MRGLFFLIVLSSLQSFSAQKNVFLKLFPKVNNADLQLEEAFYDLGGNVTSLDYFNYYLSDLILTHDGGQELDLRDTVFLVKSTNFVLYLGYLNVGVIENIHYRIGVPPNSNTISGSDAIDISAYPNGHPLSFQEPSMHWGWSAGYMFTVSAGNADSNGDDIPDAPFEMHNLGDKNCKVVDFPIVQTNIGEDQIDININCNIDVWFKDIPLSTVGVLHGTNGYNEDMMSNIETEAVFSQPLTAGMIMEVETIGKLFYSNEKLEWQGISNESAIEIFDSNGKLILKIKKCSPNGELELSEINEGCFISKIINKEGIEINRLKFIR